MQPIRLAKCIATARSRRVLTTGRSKFTEILEGAKKPAFRRASAPSTAGCTAPSSAKRRRRLGKQGRFTLAGSGNQLHRLQKSERGSSFGRVWYRAGALEADSETRREDSVLVPKRKGGSG